MALIVCDYKDKFLNCIVLVYSEKKKRRSFHKGYNNFHSAKERLLIFTGEIPEQSNITGLLNSKLWNPAPTWHNKKKIVLIHYLPHRSHCLTAFLVYHS